MNPIVESYASKTIPFGTSEQIKVPKEKIVEY
jgi:putative transposon-encoded protein